MRECVPLRTRILTKRGWLAHDLVQAGDETLGYNPQTGRSEWTVITAVHHYNDQEVWRIGNVHWHAEVTPNHRWWSDTRLKRRQACRMSTGAGSCAPMICARITGGAASAQPHAALNDLLRDINHDCPHWAA